MLHRPDEEGIIAISQPAHAWVAGQIARAWGNAPFFLMPEEVCLAAEQHDIGFLEWERSPTLNPATGLPYTFLELPRSLQLPLWRTGIQQMLRFGRYPALLTSLHYTWLLSVGRSRGHETQTSSSTDEQLISDFLEEQDALQTTLQTSLANDFYYAEISSPEIIKRFQLLVSICDWISLLLCQRLVEQRVVSEIPIETGKASLTLTPLDSAGSKISVKPWPFRTPSVIFVCEGRRLLKTYDDERQLRDSFRAAAPVTLPMQLQPG